jgi:hypothetical protein
VYGIAEGADDMAFVLSIEVGEVGVVGQTN